MDEVVCGRTPCLFSGADEYRRHVCTWWKTKAVTGKKIFKRTHGEERQPLRRRRQPRAGRREFCPVALCVNTAQMWRLNTVSAGVWCLTLWMCVFGMCAHVRGQLEQTKGQCVCVCVCAPWPPATMSISKVNTNNRARPSVSCQSHCSLWSRVKTRPAGQTTEGNEDVRQAPQLIQTLFNILQDWYICYSWRKTQSVKNTKMHTLFLIDIFFCVHPVNLNEIRFFFIILIIIPHFQHLFKQYNIIPFAFVCVFCFHSMSLLFEFPRGFQTRCWMQFKKIKPRNAINVRMFPAINPAAH